MANARKKVALDAPAFKLKPREYNYPPCPEGIKPPPPGTLRDVAVELLTAPRGTTYKAVFDAAGKWYRNHPKKAPRYGRDLDRRVYDLIALVHKANGYGLKTIDGRIKAYTASERRLSHLDDKGAAAMVDVSAKPDTARTATAKGEIRLSRQTLDLILKGETPKGDVLAAARLAGIMAAKRTAELIPLCHPLPLARVAVDFRPLADGLEIIAEAKATGKTGVEMEALTAVSVAALTIYDMVKAVERGARIEAIRLTAKDGGASGAYEAE